MRILIVEDESKLADHIKQALVDIGFVVDIARDGIEGKNMALDGSYDLMLLDVMLPGIDGFGVLQAVREKKDSPIILLTACDRVDDRVKGLHMGADDYVIKPFELPELLARVQALLRRGHVQDLAILQLGDLQLDLVKHRATRSGKRLDLTAQDFKLLALFLRRQGHVLSRAVVAEQIWDINFDCDSNVVDVAVRRLRKKVDEPFTEKLLHTVRGVGYVMETRIELTNMSADSGELPSVLCAVKASLHADAKQVLVDAGYRSEAVFEQRRKHPRELVVALGREGKV